MIKGTQKQMIVLRTGESRYFDEAYFVLRREIKSDKKSYGDILQEANRILEESRIFPCSSPARVRKKRAVLPAVFCAGAIFGAGIALLLCLLL